MSLKRVISVITYGLIMASFVLTACVGPKSTAEVPATEVAAVVTAAPPVSTEAPPATEAKPPERKVITLIWTQEFDTLSPLYTSMWFSTATFQLWDAWAWNFNDKNEAIPYLVKEIPSIENGGISADGKTITLKLRDDLKWSDGEPLTSADFVFTYQMFVDKNNAVSSAYPYDQVSSMDAPDPQTVEIKFEKPFAPWLATLWHGIIPEHVLKPVFDKDGNLNNAEWNLDPTVGCGPYLLDKWESGSFARFVVNPNYWGPKPKLDEIFIRFVPDDAAQVAALLSGDGDIGYWFSVSDSVKLKDAGINVVTEPNGFNEGIFFVINQELQPNIFDVRVRRAIAWGIDHEAIVHDLELGMRSVPTSYWDALPFYNTPPLKPYPYDPEGAKKLLDEAGWKDTNGDGVREKDGKDLTVSYGTTIKEDRQAVQAVIQQQLAQIGIKADIPSYEDNVFLASYDQDGPAAKGKVGMMEWSDASSFPDPDYYYWYCSEIPTTDYPAGQNWQYYCNKELDSLFKLQTTQVNPAERQKTFEKINQIFYDEVIWLGLWQDPDPWAISARLENVKFSGVTPFYNVTEWDLKK